MRKLGGFMHVSEETPPLAETVPCSDNLTAYDRAHFTIYMKLLTATDDEASVEEMAKDIFGIDPALEPDRAQKTVNSHVERANWILTSGYKELFAG